jgi:putative FmdB family regulatory protein
MPLYEYRCKDCEDRFEYIQPMSAGAKRKCEACGGRLEKLVSKAGFVLKGAGWYETDFREGGSRTKEPGSEKKDDDGSSEAKDGSSSEAKDGSSKGKDDAKKDGKTPAKKSSDKAGKSKAGGSKSSGTKKSPKR